MYHKIHNHLETNYIVDSIVTLRGLTRCPLDVSFHYIAVFVVVKIQFFIISVATIFLSRLSTDLHKIWHEVTNMCPLACDLYDF